MVKHGDKKVKSQIRVMKPDLQDLIRDEIYGAGIGDFQNAMNELLIIRKSDVKKIAKRIVLRSIKGH